MNVISKRLCAINQFRESRTDSWTTGSINATGTAAKRLFIWRNVSPSGAITSASRTFLHADQPALMAQIAGTIDAAATVRLMRREYWEKIKITNTETAPCRLTRYVVKARQSIPYFNCSDTETVPSTIWGLSSRMITGFTQNSAGLGTALADGTAVTANASMSLDLAESLFDNPRFCEVFKVLKVRTRVLPQADHMTLLIKRKKPKLYRKNWFLMANKTAYSAVGDAWAIKKGQVFQIFSIIGTTAEQPGAAAGFEVGVAGARVLVENNITVEYTWMDDNTRSYGKTNGVAGFDPEAAYVPAPISSVFNTNMVQAPTVPATNANAATSYMLGRTYTGGAGVDTNADMPDTSA